MLPLVVLRLALEATLAAALGLSEAVPVKKPPPKNCTLPLGLPSTRPEAPISMKRYGPPAGGWPSATVATARHCERVVAAQLSASVVTDGALVIFTVNGVAAVAAA